jgi:signal recognition particle GTPase
MTDTPVSILTDDIQLPINTRVLSTPDSNDSPLSSYSMKVRNRNHSKSNDFYFDIANRRPTYSPNSENDLHSINNRTTKELTEQLTKELTEQLTKELTEQITKELTEQITKKLTEQLTKELTEQITKKLTDELTDKVCKDMKQHMLETLSNINIKPKPSPKKCCIIS